MVTEHALRRTMSATLAAVALVIVGVALPAGAADAATRTPWDDIAQCESGGNWSIDTGNGYYGGLQFSAGTWAAHGGRGSAAAASRTEQIKIGRRVVASQGWEAWSSCSARLGLHGRALPANRAGDHRATRIAACTARTLTARFVESGSAGVTRHVDLRLTNTGAHRCRLGRALRTVYSTARGHDDGVGARDIASRRVMAAATTRSRLVLRAHGGHVDSRLAVVATADRGATCRSVDVTALVTVRKSSPHRIHASLHGLRLQTCHDSEFRARPFERHRPKHPTSHR